jgi:ribosome recycling factor
MNNEILDLTKDLMEKAVEAMEKRFAGVRAGRANPSILDGVMVDYYGVPTPLKQLATVSIPEARTIQVKPFDRGSLHNIEKGIFEADLGLTPTNNGESIMITIPPLTEDRRKELTKQVKAISEEGKVSIRNIRRESIEELEKEKLPEDEQKGLEKEIQDLVNTYNKKIDDKLKEKEEELLSV